MKPKVSVTFFYFDREVEDKLINGLGSLGFEVSWCYETDTHDDGIRVSVIRKMDKVQVDGIISELENVRQYKNMYIGSIDVSLAEAYLNGLITAWKKFGFEADETIRERIITERGWEISAARPVREMRSRGLTDEEIIHEVLTIEIETWKRIYDDL